MQWLSDNFGGSGLAAAKRSTKEEDAGALAKLGKSIANVFKGKVWGIWSSHSINQAVLGSLQLCVAKTDRYWARHHRDIM